MVFPFPELQKKVLDVVRGDDARFRGGQYAEGVYQVFLPQSQTGFLYQYIVNIQGGDGKGRLLLEKKAPSGRQCR